MKIVDEPRIYLVAKTALHSDGLTKYLNDIGDPGWFPDPCVSDAENLIEAGGE